MTDEGREEGVSESELWEQLPDAVGTIRIDILMDLSEFAHMKEEHEHALTLAEQAVEAARKEDDSQWLAKSLDRLGRRYYKLNRFEEAAAAHTEAGKHYAEYDNAWDAAFAYLHAGWSYEQLGQAEEELNVVNIALSFAETLETVPGTFYERRAIALTDLGSETGEILQAYSDARQAFREAGETFSVLRVDDTVASIMLDRGETKAAVALLSDCLDVAETLGSEQVAYFAFRVGLALNAHRDFKSALEALQRSLEIYLSQDSLQRVGAAYLEMAYSHEGLGDEELAYRTAAKARAHFDMSGDDQGVRNTDRFRAISLHGQRRYAEAAEVNLGIIETGRGFEVFAARARRADNLRAQGLLDEALNTALPIEGDDEFAGSPIWFWRESVRAQILLRRGMAEQAWAIAHERLAEDLTGASAWVQALFHELRGDSRSSEGAEAEAQADWARAVAFYLAGGHRSEATRLSEQFLPDTNSDDHP